MGFGWFENIYGANNKLCPFFTVPACCFRFLLWLCKVINDTQKAGFCALLLGQAISNLKYTTYYEVESSNSIWIIVKHFTMSLWLG